MGMSDQAFMTIYNLFHKIYVLLDDGDRRMLSDLELTPTQYNLLTHLGTEVETGATITQLAEALLCTRGNITRLVRRMEKQGVVQLGGDKHDQRLVRVALTPLGQERLAAARAAHLDSLRRRIGTFDPAKLNELIELNETLSDLLEVDLAQQVNK